LVDAILQHLRGELLTVRRCAHVLFTYAIVVSDIAIFVLKKDVKLQLTNYLTLLGSSEPSLRLEQKLSQGVTKSVFLAWSWHCHRTWQARS